MIDLRVLSPDEWPIWRAARLAALADAPEAFGASLADWQGAGDREERWRARLAVPGSYHGVALLDGVPVGMASGMPTERVGIVELLSMWVAPHMRGRGVGDRLVSAVTQWAEERGADLVRLAVADGNRPAAALYERHGFGYTGETQLMPDGVRREIIMQRPCRRDVTAG